MSVKDFQILSRLGEGSYSSVWKVKRLADGKEYALKKVKMNALSDKEKANALNEVRILASISSQFIIGYKEVFFDDNSMTLCIIMEYASGGDLYKRIQQHQKRKTFFSECEIWSVFIQIIQGLKTLHDNKILHKDIKCANVFLASDDSVKLGDLNVSKVAKNNLVYTQTGTPYYASPEIWKEQAYDSKSDIWSLGCVIYEMAALKPPFQANDMQSLNKKVQKGIFERIPPQYSHDLNEIISFCLKTSPKMRPSCDQLLRNPTVIKQSMSLGVDLIENSQQSYLFDTIKMPKNPKTLSNQLPKPNYQSQSVLLEKGVHKETIKRGAQDDYSLNFQLPSGESSEQKEENIEKIRKEYLKQLRDARANSGLPPRKEALKQKMLKPSQKIEFYGNENKESSGPNKGLFLMEDKYSNNSSQLNHTREEKRVLSELDGNIIRSRRQNEIIQKYKQINPRVHQEDGFYSPKTNSKRYEHFDMNRKVDYLIQKYNPSYKPHSHISYESDSSTLDLNDKKTNAKRNGLYKYENSHISGSLDNNSDLNDGNTNNKLRNSPSPYEVVTKPPWWG